MGEVCPAQFNFQAKTLLTNCIYLEDSSVALEGYNIYGSPWQPTYGQGGGAFQIPRDGEEAREVAGRIPADTDVLVTHGPPHGYQVKPLDTEFPDQKYNCGITFNLILPLT